LIELYVIRHGIADGAAEHDGKDEERQLTKKGREKVTGVAKYLRSRDIELDTVISSPLVRAKETAEIVRGECSSLKRIAVTDLLKPDGSYDELLSYLNSQKCDHIAIVGHEPFLSGFVSYCLSRNNQPFVRMKKAGIALISYDGRIEPGKCELLWLMGPGQMLPGE